MAEDTEKKWWRLYASRDNSYSGQRRQYSASNDVHAFEELRHWFLNHGFVVVLESEPMRPGAEYQYRWDSRNPPSSCTPLSR